MLKYTVVYYILSSLSLFTMLPANEEGENVTRSGTHVNASFDVV
jgi:hypothetical protein